MLPANDLGFSRAPQPRAWKPAQYPKRLRVFFVLPARRLQSLLDEPGSSAYGISMCKAPDVLWPGLAPGCLT